MRYLTLDTPCVLLERALALQDLVRSHMPNPAMFWPDTLAFFSDTLARGGKLVLAVEDRKDEVLRGAEQARNMEYVSCEPDGPGNGTALVAGYFLLRFPLARDADNLGRDAGLAEEELSHVAHLESVAVHPAFRGRGLALAMGQRLVALARAARKRHLLATVAPDNAASLAMLASLGLSVYDTRPKYAGLMRHIMYATLQPLR